MSAAKGKQRDPPPSLFLGPPSQNASHVSLPNILVPGTNIAKANLSSSNPTQRAPLLSQRSSRAVQHGDLDGPFDTSNSQALPRTSLPSQQQALEGQKQAARTEALWAEMQSTLEDVELSAINGTHVFSIEHSKALERLRTAQIALAQAWARSEADEAVEMADKESKALRSNGMMGSEGWSAVDGTDGTKSSVGGKPGSSSGAEKMGSNLEEETEADILHARKRREANDRYFHKVNAEVLDVVAQLEEVAGAMKAVERESRDIWEESDSTLSHGTSREGADPSQSIK
ncbi:MAG: hypothetical protein M1818_005413 [Claussenomyces sp. TS43310]|nr:MAG: hypothetical protein M1818_005413 [Claussenomyces sp. TS43310]